MAPDAELLTLGVNRQEFYRGQYFRAKYLFLQDFGLAVGVWLTIRQHKTLAQ